MNNTIAVYILCCRNGRYYTGSTDNLARRLGEHQSGYVRATPDILPVELAFFQVCKSLQDARRLEYKVKQKKSRKIIERIIQDGLISMGG